jgi:hypothetical protein
VRGEEKYVWVMLKVVSKWSTIGIGSEYWVFLGRL